MKIVKQIAVGFVVTSLCVSSVTKPTSANPAVLAPAAFCAGSAGVGCVLVGVGIVGSAIVYFIYRNQDGRNIKVTPSGKIFHSEYLEDPESVEEVGTWEDPLNTVNPRVADKICKAKAKQLGAKLIKIERNPSTNRLSCVFKGGDTK